jgi:hypothetical protein
LNTFSVIYRKMVVKTIIAKWRCKDKYNKDMRYDIEWLLECLLIRVKSPATYEHLRVNKILPLSSKDTLRKMISSMSPEFGFNDFELPLRYVYQSLWKEENKFKGWICNPFLLFCWIYHKGIFETVKPAGGGLDIYGSECTNNRMWWIATKQ